jgi:hypothetical protein
MLNIITMKSAGLILVTCINRLKSYGTILMISPLHTSFQADGKSSSPALLFL